MPEREPDPWVQLGRPEAWAPPEYRGHERGLVRPRDSNVAASDWRRLRYTIAGAIIGSILSFLGVQTEVTGPWSPAATGPSPGGRNWTVSLMPMSDRHPLRAMGTHGMGIRLPPPPTMLRVYVFGVRVYTTTGPSEEMQNQASNWKGFGVLLGTLLGGAVGYSCAMRTERRTSLPTSGAPRWPEGESLSPPDDTRIAAPEDRFG